MLIPCRRRRGRGRRHLVKTVGRATRRPAAARDRARLPYHDPRSGGHTASPRCRRRRQIRCHPHGARAATCGHGRAGRAMAAPPNWQRALCAAHAGAPNVSRLGGNYAESRLSTWMGHRPSLPDSLPVIGASRQMQGCCLLALGTATSAWPRRPRPPGRSPSSFRRSAPVDVAAFSSSPLRLIDRGGGLGPLPSARHRRCFFCLAGGGVALLGLTTGQARTGAS